jgi:hypothetical protein
MAIQSAKKGEWHVVPSNLGLPHYLSHSMSAIQLGRPIEALVIFILHHSRNHQVLPLPNVCTTGTIKPVTHVALPYLAIWMVAARYTDGQV